MTIYSRTSPTTRAVSSSLLAEMTRRSEGQYISADTWINMVT